MRARRVKGQAHRINISLDEDDYRWLLSLFPGDVSDGYRAVSVIRAARKQNLKVTSQRSKASELEQFAGWLRANKTKDKAADSILSLLEQYLSQLV